MRGFTLFPVRHARGDAHVHDIFVSYSHLDNERAPGQDTGWVEAFEKTLTIQLGQRLGRSVNVWRDRALRAGKVLDKALEAELAQSKTLVSLISPGYLQSKYCRQELAWFSRSATQGEPLVAAVYSRVIPVLLNNIPEHDWPAECTDLLAQPFHDGERGEMGRPLTPGSQAFVDAIDQLVDALAELLEHMEEGPYTPALPTPSPKPVAGKRKAYFPSRRGSRVSEFAQTNGPRVALGVAYLATLTLLSRLVGQAGQGAGLVDVVYPLVTIVVGTLTALTGARVEGSFSLWLVTQGWVLFAFGFALGLMLPLLGVLEGEAMVFALVTGVLFFIGAVIGRLWQSRGAASASSAAD